MPMKESSSGQKIFYAELRNRYMSRDSCPVFIIESLGLIEKNIF